MSSGIEPRKELMAWPWDFSTSQMEFNKNTRSLIIYLHLTLQQNAINAKILEELETIAPMAR